MANKSLDISNPVERKQKGPSSTLDIRRNVCSSTQADLCGLKTEVAQEREIKEVERIVEKFKTSGSHREIVTEIQKAKLSQESNGKIIHHILLKNPNSDIVPYSCIDLIAQYSALRTIFVLYAREHKLSPFVRFHQISHFPWVVDFLVQVIQEHRDTNFSGFIQNLLAGASSADRARILAANKIPTGLKSAAIELARDYGESKKNTIPYSGLPTSADSLVADPALPHLLEVSYDWLKSGHNKSFKYPENYLTNFRALVARNLYFQGLSVTRDTVIQETQRILKVQEKYKNIPLFTGRNVVVIAHSEKFSGIDKYKSIFNNPLSFDPNSNRFGSKHLIDSIRNDGPTNVTLLRSNDSGSADTKTKQDFLDAFVSTLPPSTFLLDNHGSFTGFSISNKMEISLDEVFDAYKKRWEKFGKNRNTQPDMFLMSTCFSSNVLRGFYILCEQNGLPKPIFSGTAEYGHIGYSNISSSFGSQYIEGFFDKKGHATLGNIMENDLKDPYSNPVLYTPDDRGVTMQISDATNVAEEEGNLIT